jgi:hypothetical protein
MTVAITDYASLSTAVNDFTERAYDQGTLDRFIGLAEAEFRLSLGPNFARETSTTITATSGSAPLPAGFLRPVSLIHLTYGPLSEGTIAAVRERRVWDTSGIPDMFAVTGSTVEVAPSYTGSLTLDYEGTLTGLSSGNTTNWLITNAPQAYLKMVIAMSKAFEEDYQSAATFTASAMQNLTDLGIQSMVAQLGRARPQISGMTP